MPRNSKERFAHVNVVIASGEFSWSMNQDYFIKDGHEVVVTTKNVNGRLYAKARKRKIDANNGC